MSGKTKSLTILETRKVGYEGFYYLILPDHAAGKKNRFTVYRIPSSPSRRIKIIGRELTIGNAKKLLKRVTYGKTLPVYNPPEFNPNCCTIGKLPYLLNGFSLSAINDYQGHQAVIKALGKLIGEK